MIVRLETAGDIQAIRIVEEIAFGQRDEAQLVDDLRDAGDAVFSLVAVKDGMIAGHAMFSRMQAPFPALALGPIAVLPEYRRTGIASTLIREGIARSEVDAWRGISCSAIPRSIGVLDSTFARRAASSRPIPGRI
jgi:putative acetyltransferase